VPSRLTLGDRSVIAVQVQNAQREPVDARVSLDGGAGLRIETVRRASNEETGLIPFSGKRGLSPFRPDEAVPLRLAPGAEDWIYATVEASQPTASAVTVEIATGDTQRREPRRYEVLAVEPGAAAPWNLAVTRTLTVWYANKPLSPTGQPVEGRRPWTSRPWSPEDRLLPGQQIQVHEEFTIAEPRAGLLWDQRVPPTCSAPRSGVSETKPIGMREPGRGDEIRLRVPPLARGDYVNDYPLVVVRPGACFLPPPEIYSGALRVPVIVSPVEVRLIVEEAGDGR
jgi:hypothetical protein